MDENERTLWVGYIVLACGFALLGFVVGVTGFGKELDLGDIVSFSTLCVALIGVNTYQKAEIFKHRREIVASLERENFKQLLNTLSLNIQCISYSLWYVINNIVTEERFSSENAKSLRDSALRDITEIERGLTELECLNKYLIPLKRSKDIHKPLMEITDYLSTLKANIKKTGKFKLEIFKGNLTYGENKELIESISLRLKIDKSTEFQEILKELGIEHCQDPLVGIEKSIGDLESGVNKFLHWV